MCLKNYKFIYKLIFFSLGIKIEFNFGVMEELSEKDLKNQLLQYEIFTQEMKKDSERQIIKSEFCSKLTPFMIRWLESAHTDIDWLIYKTDAGKKNFVSLLESEFGRDYPDSIERLKRSLNQFDLVGTVFQFEKLRANDKFVKVTASKYSEFFPFQYLYERDCYDGLLQSVIEASDEGNAIVTGDSDIGMSTFIRFLYYKNESSRKMFWVMESGFWVYADKNSISSGRHENDIWRNADVLLLIDGVYLPKYLSKLKNVILFCSPNGSNYQKLFNERNARIVFMPPWSEEEVLTLFNLVPQPECSNECLGVALMQPLIDSLSNMIEAETSDSQFSDVESDCDSDIFASKDQEFEIISNDKLPLSVSESELPDVENYNELREYVKISTPRNPAEIENFLRINILMRFKIIGGRINQLLNPYTSVERLHNEVAGAVMTLNALQVPYFSPFEVEKRNPSICIVYSLYPSPTLAGNYFASNLTIFATEFIEDMAINYFKCFQKSILNDIIFKNIGTKNLYLASLIFQIVKRAVHNFLIRKLDVNLPMRSLNISSSSELDKEPSGDLKFGSEMKLMTYLTKTPDFRTLISELSDGDIVYMRRSTNYYVQHQIDSIVIRKCSSSTKVTIDFIQITDELQQDIDRTLIQKLAAVLGTEISQIRYIYLVPPHLYNIFKQQRCFNSDKSSNYPLIRQYVACIPKEAFSVDYL